jgi:hypothetical protein
MTRRVSVKAASMSASASMLAASTARYFLAWDALAVEQRS